MAELFINTISKSRQYLISFLVVALVSLISYGFSRYIDYRVVAFILLVTVSLLAVSFDILPVFFAAALSALVWDYFFIPPFFTLQVASTEDAILLLTYFVVAMVNAVLTYKIRQVEEIARQKEEKAGAVKLYNTLLNSLSHELRTPIASIIGATDNLLQEGSKLTDRQRTELLNQISISGFRLNQQVSNLLNMARLESGYLRPANDWCDITELIYTVVHEAEEKQDISQRISINIQPSFPLFKLDKGMLSQVLFNLVINAALYAGNKARIIITAHAYGELLEIIIEDDGKGFPENEIDHVFEKFYRLKHSNTGGTGLGLSIVKGFVEAMGGNISLSNKPTGGAIFNIAIPAPTSYL